MKFYKVWKMGTHDWVLCENCLEEHSRDFDERGRMIHYSWRETWEKEIDKCHVCGVEGDK